ncbi:hypothetical protein [Cellulomonas phragmiteti]|nr:hypothetical protein [Cellulomonas phragmiteti]
MERGSARLLDDWKNGGFVLEERLIERLLKSTGSLVIDSWYIKGQPRPDWLHTSFDVDGVEQCGTVVKDIAATLGGLGLGRAGGIRVFPKGIPADVFTIELQVGAP